MRSKGMAAARNSTPALNAPDRGHSRIAYPRFFPGNALNPIRSLRIHPTGLARGYICAPCTFSKTPPTSLRSGRAFAPRSRAPSRSQAAPFASPRTPRSRESCGVKSTAGSLCSNTSCANCCSRKRDDWRTHRVTSPRRQCERLRRRRAHRRQTSRRRKRRPRPTRETPKPGSCVSRSRSRAIPAPCRMRARPTFARYGDSRRQQRHPAMRVADPTRAARRFNWRAGSRRCAASSSIPPRTHAA